MSTTPLTPEQIAALRALLATVDAGSAEYQAGQQFSENPRDSTDDGTAKEIAMCRIDGPFFQPREVQGSSGRQGHEEDQELHLRDRGRGPQGDSEARCRPQKVTYLETERQNRPSTIQTTMGRVRTLFIDIKINRRPSK
jgi:hypothetical protein